MSRFYPDGALFGTKTGVEAIPATTTYAAIENWNHSADRHWEGQVEYLSMFDRLAGDD